MHEKVPTNLNFVERENEVLKFWKDNDIAKKSGQGRDGRQIYSFYDGPPTANGTPHIGHVITRAVKDMIPRYHAMKGSKVVRKAGWDTHGLPVELEVEKRLGLEGKDQIEEYGLEPFIEECKKSVWKYKGMWEEFSDVVGFWADMDDPYVTYHNDYIESVWWSLKQIWEKDLLYKGHKIVPYCPRCETPLSTHEVAQGYKDVKEKSVIAKFKVKDAEGEYLLAWTTTPWTLPSNVALCVNANEDYVKVCVDKEGAKECYYLAEALLSIIEDEYEVVERMKGKGLEYKGYEPLFDYAKPDKKCHYVTCDDYVTLTDGTGIVHIAPAFGEDDARVGRDYGLPFVQLVDEKGNFKAEAADLAGMFCKDADKEIIRTLKEAGLLFKTLAFEHSYPFCWRCESPLIYYARETWFIKMTAVRDELVANNDSVNWVPESIGKGRFGDWLKNIQDWGLSRNRYWGTPLNIWECECGHAHAVGSIEELKSLSKNCPDDVELHRPFIDAVTIACPKCGKEMNRVPEVIDCWYDSGAMPFAQWHYPFENKELFDENFPADFISEAVDQTRGWFYSLIAISTLVFGRSSFQNVIVLGHVLDKDGQKMSKSKGNAIEPMDVLREYGADAVRWYFYSNSAPWIPNRFQGKGVTEGQRKLLGTLWNTYAFYVLYAGIDGFDAAKHQLEYDKLAVMDQWLLSKLSTMVKTMDEGLAAYRIPETVRALQDFVDDMSNWYVRRCRERFWAKGMEQDKVNAYMTLYTALVTTCKAAAPMIPFMTESIYRNLVCSLDPSAPISIHLTDYPSYNEEWVDEEREDYMGQVLKAVVLGRACRNAANVKNRQPLGRMYVKMERRLPQYYADILADELNVKDVEFAEDVGDFTDYQFKPQLRTLGKRFGKDIGTLKTILESLDGREAMSELKEKGVLTVTVNGVPQALEEGDLLIEEAKREGYVTETNHNITVVLDTRLSPELIEEGYVRELISKIQTMRKDAGFEVMDHINVYHSGNDKIRDVIEGNLEQIKREVLAEEVCHDKREVFSKEWEINGEGVVLGVEKR